MKFLQVAGDTMLIVPEIGLRLDRSTTLEAVLLRTVEMMGCTFKTSYKVSLAQYWYNIPILLAKEVLPAWS